MPTKEIAPGVLAVTELPYDAKCFVGGGDTPFCANPDGEYLNCRFGGSGLNIALPPGSWSLLGKASELTEEQIYDLIESMDGFFKDYCTHQFDLISSKNSYASFLTFHGIKENDILLIENKN